MVDKERRRERSRHPGVVVDEKEKLIDEHTIKESLRKRPELVSTSET